MFIVMFMQAASEHLGLYGGQWWLQSMDIWSAPEVHEKFPEVALGCEFAAIMSSGKIIFKIGLIVLDAFSLHFLVLQSLHHRHPFTITTFRHSFHQILILVY